MASYHLVQCNNVRETNGKRGGTLSVTWSFNLETSGPAAFSVGVTSDPRADHIRHVHRQIYKYTHVICVLYCLVNPPMHLSQPLETTQ